MKQGVVILRSNEVDPDPRVEKTAMWLSENYEITILAWNRTMGSLSIERKNQLGLIYRHANAASYGSGFRGLLALIKFNYWLFQKLYKLRKTYSVIHACDLDTVLPAIFIARIFRKKLVYDIFDYFSASRGLTGIVAGVVNTVENFCIRHSNAVILVDHSRYAQIPSRLPEYHGVVYNVPDFQDEVLSGPGSTNRIVYVGILQEHRFLRELCALISKMPEWEFCIAGFGALEEHIALQAKTYDNIKFMGRVSYQAGLALSSTAKVVVAIYDPAVPNHRYCSPNKFFEALALGKIIIAANDTAIDQKVNANGIGYTFDYTNKEQLTTLLLKIASLSRKELEDIGNRGRLLADNRYAVSLQKEVLVSLYRNVTNKLNQIP